jgi:hypothetical protein
MSLWCVVIFALRGALKAQHTRAAHIKTHFLASSVFLVIVYTFCRHRQDTRTKYLLPNTTVSTMALTMHKSAGMGVNCRTTQSRSARLVVRASLQEQQQTVHSGHAMLAAAVTASMLAGAVQLAVPEEAFAANARSGGRASASKFSSRRQAMR